VREAERDPGMRRPGESDADASDLQGLRVLVVEDDADARFLIEDALQSYGATVTTVSSVREALAFLESFPVDVLLSDIGMAGEDGFSLIERLRSRSDRLGRLPAAAVTAYASNEDRRRALAAGYQEHVPKPVAPAALAAVVQSLARKGEHAKLFKEQG
jgi:CheY-like chemotaxis protein